MINVQIIPFLGDRAKEFAQKRACIEAQGWEPYQEWFYDNEFRQETKFSLITLNALEGDYLLSFRR